MNNIVVTMLCRRTLGRRLRSIVVSLACITGGAAASESMPGYKQFILGAELTSVRALAKLDCRVAGNLATCIPTTPQTLLEEPVESMILRFASGRLGQIEIVVKPAKGMPHDLSRGRVEKSYQKDLTDALSQRYGTPTHTFYNYDGSVGHQHGDTYTWRTYAASVTLEVHRSDWESTRLLYESDSFASFGAEVLARIVPKREAPSKKNESSADERERRRRNDL